VHSFRRLVTIIDALSICAALCCTVVAADNAPDKEVLGRPATEVGDFPGKHQEDMGEHIVRSKATLEMRHEAVENIKTRALRSLKDGAYLEAITLLKAALRAEPANTECRRALCDARVQYGDSLREKQQVKEAVEEYRTALSENELCKEAKERLEKPSEVH
jgi:tetratricopeptide (TPR) repeat protein